MRCYRVKVKTTNTAADTFSLMDDEYEGLGEYRDCEDGTFYVVANSVKEAVGDIPSEYVEEVTAMGVGYEADDLRIPGVERVGEE